MQKETKKMRMMLVGAGAVGESILRILQWRDPEGGFLEYVLITDYDESRAKQVREIMGADGRFAFCHVDATDKEEMTAMMLAHDITFVMDAAPPFASNYIFDAAFAAGADYANLGTWSVPKDEPAYGLGIENSYTEPMTKYNFDRMTEVHVKDGGNLSVYRIDGRDRIPI